MRKSKKSCNLIKFNKESPEDPLLISGTDAQIVWQTSLLNAFNQLLESRGLGYFDWKDWVSQFEVGYSRFTTGASKELKELWNTSVYPGIAKDNAPKIVEIKQNANLKKDATYKVVQLYPDRKNEQEWLIFSGSYREIAVQIENWWNQKTASSVAGKGGSLPYLKGQPLILWTHLGSFRFWLNICFKVSR